MRYAAALSALQMVGRYERFRADVFIMNDIRDLAHAEEVAMARCKEIFLKETGCGLHKVIVTLIPDEQPAVVTKASKPVPRELIISTLGSDTVVSIVASSPDAKEWIETEAECFGNLYPILDDKGKYTLIISKAYDPKQVCAYLNSYNDPAPDLA